MSVNFYINGRHIWTQEYNGEFVPVKSDVFSPIDCCSVLESICYCAHCNCSGKMKIEISHCVFNGNIKIHAKCHGEQQSKEIDTSIWPFSRSRNADELCADVESLVNQGVFTFFGQHAILKKEEPNELDKILDNMDGF